MMTIIGSRYMLSNSIVYQSKNINDIKNWWIIAMNSIIKMITTKVTSNNSANKNDNQNVEEPEERWNIMLKKLVVTNRNFDQQLT